MSRKPHLHTVFAFPPSWIRLWSLPSRHILEMFQRPSLVVPAGKQSSVLVIYAFRSVLVTGGGIGKTYGCGKPNGGPLGSSLHSTKLPRKRLSHVPRHRAEFCLGHRLLLRRLGPVSEVKKCPGRDIAAITHGIRQVPLTDTLQESTQTIVIPIALTITPRFRFTSESS